MGKLEDKVGVITGGVSGIGLATVELFVAEGARVVVGDIQDGLGQALQARFPGKVIYAHTDVTDDEAIGALVKTAVDSFGKLDIMYNNAGAAGDTSSMLEITPGGLERTLSLLTQSVVSGHKYAARQFLAQGTGGSIISTASIAGMEGGWGPAGYTIAKHSVIGVVRQAVAEFARAGIRSNAICPGNIMTPIMASAFGVPADRASKFESFLVERLGPGQPSGRVGMPNDIAEVVVFLASDSSAYVNGVVLPIDGGATAVTMGSFGADIVKAAEEFMAN